MLLCSGCKLQKQENEFYREKYRSRGYSIWCKACTLLRERKRRGSTLERPRPRSFDRKKYYEENKAYYASKSAERRANKRKFPLTKEMKKQITEIYKEARERGMVVDHIHPINHPLLCGLHVPWNLQIITAEANGKKGNKLVHRLPQDESDCV